MSDYPERISISPVHRQKHDDDFYLVDRKAFPGKGTEYVRADRIEELEAKLAKAVEALEMVSGIIHAGDDPDGSGFFDIKHKEIEQVFSAIAAAKETA